MKKEVRLYTLFIICLGLSFLSYLTFTTSFNWEIAKAFLFWSILILVTESLSTSLPQGGSVTLGFPIVYAALLIYGPAFSSWIAFCGGMLEFKSKKDKKGKIVYKVFFDGAQLTISISLAWLVYRQLGGTLITTVSSGNIVYLGLSALVYFMANSFLVSIVLSMEKKTSFMDMWLSNFKWLTPNYLAQTPLGFLMAVIYTQISWWAVIFIMFPLLIAYYSYKLYTDKQKEHLSIIQALASAVEARDPYTEKHSKRMAEYAMATARELGFSIYDTQVVHYAAILHDIGKIGVSDYILSKPGSLTNEEREKIQTHSQIGADIVAQIDSFKEASKLVHYHHERYNGRGYPKGLKGENIPLGAKIIAVVDAYDAMTSRRPYRQAYPKEKAIAELKKNMGTQFDEKVVEAFLRMIERNVT